MKGEFMKYLYDKAICAADSQINEAGKKFEAIYNFFCKLCPDEITGFFVNNYLDEDITEPETLWLFSKKCIMETKQFLKEDEEEFHIYAAVLGICLLDISKQKYNLENATKSSELSLTIKLDRGEIVKFSASRYNCDQLKDILLEYLKPNLK